MKTILTRFWHATLFLLTAVTIMSAADSPSIPKHFSASIGGFMGSTFELELHGDDVTYTTFGRGRTGPRRATVTPTEVQWREFRQALDDLKVWQWRPEYPNTGTVDGTQWALDISYTDHAIKSHGDNNYPDDAGKPNDKPDPTKSFNRFLDAVKKLTGGKTFQ